MKSVHIPTVLPIAATIASFAATLALLSVVVSLSEPQRSHLIAATASRQMATQRKNVLVAQSTRVQPTPVAEVTAR